jgi:hypothetical protein
MEPGATVLRDIHDLDAIPWWPLAPGWWYLAGLVGLLLLSFGIRYWLIYNAGWLGWRGDARRQLRQLRKALASKALTSEDTHAVAGRLSELLRRIAMVRSGRQQAAGLTGDTWLQWLAEHDSTAFNWEQHGQILLTAPYMPPTMSVERKQLLTLIRAATRWIDASRPTEKKAGLSQRLAGWLSGAFGKGGATRV